MAGIETLEISRLDEAGQVIRRIRCLAGRVTVFRANSAELLESYHKAFEGVRQKERFSMILDTATFNPHEHHLIGFGERFGDSKKETVANYLQSNGLPANLVEQMLLGHGLGGLAAALCCELSPAQERIVRILGATASIDKVLILNDPFEIVPDQWREKLAALIVDYAWKKKAIVVVTKLTYRPQEWIENEIIARTQLERPRQRTIGFGGEGFNPTELIQAVRAQFNQGDAKQAPPVAPPVEAMPPSPIIPAKPKTDLLLAPQNLTTRQKLVSQALAFGQIEPVKTHSLGWGLGLSMCVLVVVVTAIIAYGQIALYSRPEPISRVITQPKNPENQAPNTTEAKPVLEVKKVSVLDSYPSHIKDAVLQAFSDPQTQLQIASTVVANKAPAKVIEQTNFTYQPPPSVENNYVDPSSLTDNEMERRREEIRQRFLQAIQAQAQQN